jgi:hypothetical protein
MTTGFGTAAAGQPPYEQYEAAEQQRYDREQQKAHWIELGAAVLGHVQLPVRQVVRLSAMPGSSARPSR